MIDNMPDVTYVYLIYGMHSGELDNKGLLNLTSGSESVAQLILLIKIIKVNFNDDHTL
jgi:3-methyladenine DNA glycosylase Mpg